MTLYEAKAKYEENGGHYFEWFDFFGQELMEFYDEQYRTFIVKSLNRYSVLGFDLDYKRTVGYGNQGGYKNYSSAVRVAKNPGGQKW